MTSLLTRPPINLSADEKLYQSFLLSVASATKAVTVELTTDALHQLKQNQYSLCFAKKVGDTFNVVWSSSKWYLSTNQFSWQPQYQLFGTNTFNTTITVKATTNTVAIGLGETSVLDADGFLESPKTGGPSTSITMDNEYGGIHPGVNQLSTGIDGAQVSSAIYVAENAVLKGSVSLTPKESVLVWFEQNIETGAMFSSARTNSYEVDMTFANTRTIQFDGTSWSLLG
jgi:hypothetical protein